VTKETLFPYSRGDFMRSSIHSFLSFSESRANAGLVLLAKQIQLDSNCFRVRAAYETPLRKLRISYRKIVPSAKQIINFQH
jgi:hypothetical protein